MFTVVHDASFASGILLAHRVRTLLAGSGEEVFALIGLVGNQSMLFICVSVMVYPEEPIVVNFWCWCLRFM